MQCVSDGGSAEATRLLTLPDDAGYAWAAGEAAAIAAILSVLVDTHRFDKNHSRAAAYWVQGSTAHNETLRSC